MAPLMAAVVEGDVDTVSALLEGGASPNIDDELQGTPLGFAVNSNCLPMVEVLLAHGAAVDFYKWQPPLYWAVHSDGRDMIQLLLDAGADPSSMGTAYWETALHQAVGLPSLLEIMLPYASDVDVGLGSLFPRELPLEEREFISPESPLESAAELGRLEAIDILLRAGAQITPTAIYVGIRSGELVTVFHLLDSGPDLGSWHESDRRFLSDYAQSAGHQELARRLEK